MRTRFAVVLLCCLALLLNAQAQNVQTQDAQTQDASPKSLPTPSAEVQQTTPWQFRLEQGIAFASQHDRNGDIHPEEGNITKYDFGMLMIHTRPTLPHWSFISGLRVMGRGRYRSPNVTQGANGPVQFVDDEVWGQYMAIPLLARYNLRPERKFSWTFTGGLQLHSLVQISGRTFDSDDFTELFDFNGPWRQNPQSFQLDPGVSFAAGFRVAALPHFVFSLEAFYDGMYFNAFNTDNFPLSFWDSAGGVRLSFDLPLTPHHTKSR